MGRLARPLTWVAARLLYVAGWQDVRLVAAVGEQTFVNTYRFGPCLCVHCRVRAAAVAREYFAAAGPKSPEGGTV